MVIVILILCLAVWIAFVGSGDWLLDCFLGVLICFIIVRIGWFVFCDWLGCFVCFWFVGLLCCFVCGYAVYILVFCFCVVWVWYKTGFRWFWFCVLGVWCFIAIVILLVGFWCCIVSVCFVVFGFGCVVVFDLDCLSLAGFCFWDFVACCMLVFGLGVFVGLICLRLLFDLYCVFWLLRLFWFG